jgi:hypothetical protein
LYRNDQDGDDHDQKEMDPERLYGLRRNPGVFSFPRSRACDKLDPIAGTMVGR